VQRTQSRGKTNRISAFSADVRKNSKIADFAAVNH
jgi:hypothetical protein